MSSTNNDNTLVLVKDLVIPKGTRFRHVEDYIYQGEIKTSAQTYMRMQVSDDELVYSDYFELE